MNKSSQQGLTLLELMVALVLGLLIVAAGLAVFLNAQRAMGFQTSMGDIQQNANFGLSMLTQDLRHANLNTPSAQRVNNKFVGSGIVFVNANLPAGVRTNTANRLTAQGISEDATQAEASDQLTMQFMPDVRGDDQFDCEGNAMVAGRTYVYRYYVDKLLNHQQIAGSLDRFGLYCDSGFYVDSSNSVVGLGANGQLIIQNVDAFKVRLLVKNPNGNLRYTTIDEYLALMPTSVVDEKQYVNVIGIELGLLVTSSQSIGADASFNTSTKYTIAGQEVELQDNTNNGKYLRQAITQVVGLRNTLGAE
ncbi:PilW family protein [Acinetobacter johnsonii]|uniref:PilW family protein n=1 Tax=Acinetobacter johnsonii TaxID=40214 RepID=A0AAW6RRB7_ACIJO|nr:PilW family protein [Acinetobacter johnsonii]MDG9786954.1 PilW family protein [Acinetobacter johnsonii]MDG9797936.1 PilW family protein [Acinetobacter johnsonii]